MTIHSSRLNARSTAGFTLVELLIVIAIIAVLAGLLLPAVQAARESARSMQCKNSMKQLSLAVINYESAHGAIPPATNYSEAQFHGFAQWAWGAAVLPHIEQTALFNAIDFDLAPSLPPNRALLTTELSVFRCPSEVGPRLSKIRDPSELRELQLTVENYGYNRDLDLLVSDRMQTRFRDVVDGLSNTVLLGEVTYGVSHSEMAGFGKMFTASGALCTAIGFKGWGDLYFASHIVETREISKPAERTGLLMASSSYHPGGVHCALFDGSVQFLPASTNPKVLEAISTLQGGEVVSDF